MLSAENLLFHQFNDRMTIFFHVSIPDNRFKIMEFSTQQPIFFLGISKGGLKSVRFNKTIHIFFKNLI